MWKKMIRLFGALVVWLLFFGLWEMLPWISNIKGISAGIISTILVGMIVRVFGDPIELIKELKERYGGGADGEPPEPERWMIPAVGMILAMVFMITVVYYIMQGVSGLIKPYIPGGPEVVDVSEDAADSSDEQEGTDGQKEGTPEENGAEELSDSKDTTEAGDDSDFPGIRYAKHQEDEEEEEKQKTEEQIQPSDKESNKNAQEDETSGALESILEWISKVTEEKTENSEPPRFAGREEDTENTRTPGDGTMNSSTKEPNAPGTSDDPEPDHSGSSFEPEIPDASVDEEPEKPNVSVPPAPEAPGPIVDEEPEKPNVSVPTAPEAPGPIADEEPEKPNVSVPPAPEAPGPIVDEEPEKPSVSVPPAPEAPGPIVDEEPEKPSVSVPTTPEAPGPIVDEEPEKPDDVLAPAPDEKPDGSESKDPEPDEDIEQPTQRNDYKVPAVIKKEGEALPRQEVERIVSEEEADQVTLISGETRILDRIYYAGQERWYEMNPSVSGTCYFEIVSEKDCAEYEVEFYKVNEDGAYSDRIAFSEVITGDVMPVEMTSQETYEIRIEQPWGFGGYELCIGYPQEEQDISDYHVYQNQLQYPEEKQVYLLTPKETGCYRFDVAGLAENEDVQILVEGEDESQDVYTGNKTGLTVTRMLAGETYRVVISQEKGFGTYQLKIGHQKETVDLTGYTGAEDSIEFQDQINCYEVKVEKSGIWHVQLLDMQGEEFAAELRIYDAEGKPVDSCSCTSECSKELYGEAEEGEFLSIQVQGTEGTGTYLLDYKL